jgi:hypothetical protein
MIEDMTMEEDIIRYSLQEMLDVVLDANNDESNRVVQKVKEFITSRDCFVENSAQSEFNSHGHNHRRSERTPRQHTRHNTHGSNHASGHHSRGGPPNIIKKEFSREARVVRELTSCFNKLNTANFEKVGQQIQRCFFMDISKSMDILLDRCAIQAGFLSIFIRLYECLLKNATDTQKIMMHESLNNHVQVFIDSRSFSSIGSMDAGGYSDYCDWVSRKKNIIGTHQLSLTVIRQGYVTCIDTHSYFCDLISALYEELDDFDTEDIGRQESVEIIIDLLREFFLIKDPHTLCFYPEWQAAIQDAYDDPDVKIVLPIKCQIKLLNVLEII